MANSDTRTAVVLFTKNWAGKAQAGRFPSDQAERASAAAHKHGASIVTFSEGDDADLLAATPAGKFGENDRPIFANIKIDQFKRLAEIAEKQATASQAEKSQEKATEADDAKQAPQVAARKKAAPMLSKASDKASGDAVISIVVKNGGKHWPELSKGDVVLAPDFAEGEYSGWWEAVVQARSDSHVTLAWRDYPDFPSFTRPVTQIAPIHPECAVKGWATM